MVESGSWMMRVYCGMHCCIWDTRPGRCEWREWPSQQGVADALVRARHGLVGIALGRKGCRLAGWGKSR